VNGKKAKMIRRQVFGKKGSHRVRQYRADIDKAVKLGQVVRGPNGIQYNRMPTIFDGGLRSVYKKAKKLAKEGGLRNEKKEKDL